jgi:radical SAM protein with 4Fe4S-binding SPASM domain
VLKNIRLLRKNGILVRINTTLIKGYNDGIDTIKKMLKLCNRLKINSIAIGSFMKYGRGRNDLTPGLGIVKKISEIDINRKTANIPKNVHLKLTDRPKSVKGSFKNTYCGIGTCQFAIKPNGDMVFCPVLSSGDFVVGNVLKDDVKKLWLTSEKFDVFRKNNVNSITKCRNCDMKMECLGGCKARCYIESGRFNAPDEWMCSYHKL